MDSHDEHHSDLSSSRAADSLRCLQHVVDEHQAEESAEDDHCVQQSILVERVPWHTDYVHRHRARKQVRVVPLIDSLRTTPELLSSSVGEVPKKSTFD